MAKVDNPAAGKASVRVIRGRGIVLDGKAHPLGALLHLPKNQANDLIAAGVVKAEPAVTESTRKG